MRKSNTKLAPTLWRTCRAMMNPLRLQLLRLVFEHDDEYTVTEFAKALHIEQSTATIYLRQLNARGLIGVRRQRIKVFYNTEPDRSLPEALAIRESMRELCREKLTKGWLTETMTVLRAFTHFNRLAILGELMKGPATLQELSKAIGVCVKSLHHHLAFLMPTGMVSVSGYPLTLSLRDDVHPLATALLGVLRSEFESGRSYRNNARPERLDHATRMVLRKVASAEGNPRLNWQNGAKMKPKRGRMSASNRKAHLEVDAN